MAYIKDPKTGKYIQTGTTAPVKSVAPVEVPAPASAPIKYSKDASGKYVTTPSDTPTTKPKVTTVAGLRDYATQQGLDVSGAQPKESVLQKILHVLNTGGYAVGGLISGKGIKAGIKEHILPSEALGIKSKVGGFIVDVLLDPTTYISFGYGAGAKLATKAGTVVLSKTGTSLLKKSIVELGEQGARKMLAEKVLAEGGEKLLAKGGLKMAGVQVLPRNVVTAPFKAADWIAEKTPILGKMYQGAKDVAGKAFVPFKSIKELPGGIGQEYVDKFTNFSKATRDEVSKAVQEATDLGKTAKKEIGATAGIDIGKILETPAAPIASAVADAAPIPKRPIDNIIDYIRGEHKKFATVEKEKGILDTELPDYVRHYLTPEGREFVQKTGMNITAELNKPLRVKNPFAKTRQLDDTIEGINKYFGSRYGIKLFEPDAFKAFAARKAEHVKAVNTYDFLTDIGKQFGRQAEITTKQVKNSITGKMTTKEVIKPIFENSIRYIESSVPQLKGTLMPEQIVKHVDDTYKTLMNEEATKKFISFYDKVLGFWKGSVIGWFPAFHVRNIMGGIFNNWIGGVKSPARYLQGDQIARGIDGVITTKLGTKYTYNQIRELANRLGVVGQPGYLDVMREVEKDGFSQYLYGLGLPVEDINRLYRGTPQRTLAGFVGELSPLLKYPIEAGTGQNLFTGEPIIENSRVFPFINAVPGLRDWLEVSEHKNQDGSVSYRGNAYKLHFLNTALGRFYNTAGKLTDDKSSGAVKFLYGVMGAKAKSVDIEKEKFWRDQELRDRLEQALESRGLINKFERAYVPK